MWICPILLKQWKFTSIRLNYVCIQWRIENIFQSDSENVHCFVKLPYGWLPFLSKNWNYFHYRSNIMRISPFQNEIEVVNQSDTDWHWRSCWELLAKLIYIYNFEITKLYFSSSQILLGKFRWLHARAKFYIRKYLTFLKLFQSIQAQRLQERHL